MRRYIGSNTSQFLSDKWNPYCRHRMVNEVRLKLHKVRTETQKFLFQLMCWSQSTARKKAFHQSWPRTAICIGSTWRCWIQLFCMGSFKMLILMHIRQRWWHSGRDICCGCTEEPLVPPLVHPPPGTWTQNWSLLHTETPAAFRRVTRTESTHASASLEWSDHAQIFEMITTF